MHLFRAQQCKLLLCLNSHSYVAISFFSEAEFTLAEDAFRTSSGDRILTVGDGDLSFSHALVKYTGLKKLPTSKRAAKRARMEAQKNGNVIQERKRVEFVATTYDSEENLLKMYDPWIKYTLRNLRSFEGVRVHHGFDATKIHERDKEFLSSGFDLVVWNHPHSGFPANHPSDHKGPGFEQSDAVLERHTSLVRNFFDSISRKGVLRDNARVCISHKTIVPFDKWDVPNLGSDSGFVLASSFPFPQPLFPEYVCRRGTGK